MRETYFVDSLEKAKKRKDWETDTGRLVGTGV